MQLAPVASCKAKDMRRVSHKLGRNDVNISILDKTQPTINVIQMIIQVKISIINL